jgi:hypothetical protein
MLHVAVSVEWMVQLDEGKAVDGGLWFHGVLSIGDMLHGLTTQAQRPPGRRALSGKETMKNHNDSSAERAGGSLQRMVSPHVEYKLPDHPEQIMVFETHELAEGARRRGIVCVAMPGMNLHAAKQILQRRYPQARIL